MFVATLAFFVFGANKTFAQSSLVSLKWDKEVSCQTAVLPDDDPRKPYETQINDNSCIKVCENSNVTYTVQGDDNSTWQSTTWNVVGGTILNSGTSFCQVNWGVSGTGIIGGNVTTSYGSENIANKCIEIIKKPIAHFGVLPDLDQSEITACIDQLLYFQNTSNANGVTDIDSYFWDFGDSNYSAEQNPIHSYTESGIFEVTLTVKNNCKCDAVYSMAITVGRKGINIVCPAVVCQGEVAKYSVDNEVMERCNGRMNWSVSGGSILSPQPYTDTIEVLWSTPDSGFGIVNFDARRCDLDCPSITTTKVPIITDRIGIVGEQNPCMKNQYRYKLPQWPTTKFDWKITTTTNAVLIPTDQRNEVIIQTGDSGLIVLSATYKNSLLGCGGQTSNLNIEVKEPMQIQGLRTACLGNEVYTLPAGISGNWTLKKEDGAVLQTAIGNSINCNFSLAGNYTLEVATNSFCNTEPIKIKVLAKPIKPLAIDVIGARVVCPGDPQTYSITNNIPDTTIGWDIEGGVIHGSKYGLSISAAFNPSVTTPYSLILWRENTLSPRCKSDTLRIPIRKPDLNLKIVPTNTIYGIKPCPSSLQYYTIRTNNLANQLYEQGEVYDWSIEDPTLGSVVEGNGTGSIAVQWNNFTVNTVKKLKLMMRKCSGLYLYTIDVTIEAIPSVNIVAPDVICEKQNFIPDINVASSQITWYIDEIEIDTTLPNAFAISMNSPTDTNHILKAVAGRVNGCDLSAVVTKVITTNAIPSGIITNDYSRSFCTLVPFTLNTFVNAMFGTPYLTWFKDNLQITASSGAATLTVTQFGVYYAVFTNPVTGCFTRTKDINITQNCGGSSPTCSISPDPIFTTVSAPTICQEIQSNVTFAVGTATPLSYDWSCPSIDATLKPNFTNLQSTFSFTRPGKYAIYYTAFYPAASGITNETCAKSVSSLAIVPYLAKMKHFTNCGIDNLYTITLKNESLFFYETPIEAKEFFVNNISQGIITNQGIDDQIIDLPPGTYVLKLKISRAGYAPCFAEETVFLPNKPDATFTYTSLTCNSACGEVCQNKALKFNVTNPYADEVYYWDFSESTNIQQNPGKVFANAGSYNITLTVTNKFGCISTFIKNVIVQPNNVNGSISVSPDLNCEGSNTLLTFNNGGTEPATHFVWMKNDKPVPNTTDTPTFNVQNSASYWVMVSDQYGCTFPTPTKPATFVMVPDFTIAGPSSVCTGQNFKLSGFAGGATTQYQWTEVISNTETILKPYSNTAFDLTKTLTGNNETHFYKLTIRVPKGNNAFCYSDPQTKIVKVYGEPSLPVVWFDPYTVNCNPYSITLHATATEEGTFTWSNGESGQNGMESIITVNEGGLYQVRFTNPAGCEVTQQVKVPQNPTIYMWIFPYGCYDFCQKEKENMNTILGPMAQFPTWEWQANGNAVSSGSGFVADYNLQTYNTTYNLMLNNGYCSAVSRAMDVQYSNCADCGFKIENNIVDLRKEGFCAYDVSLTIYNPYETLSTTLSINLGNAIIIPSSLMLLPGTNTYNFQIIPIAGLLAANIVVNLKSLVEGRICITRVRLALPSECNTNGRSTNNLSDGMMANDRLTISPNPAVAQTDINYTFINSTVSNCKIEVYDLLGRLLASHQPTVQKESWQLSLAGFTQGQYIVVMKENNQVIVQKNLQIK